MYRLMQTFDAPAIATTISGLRSHDLAGPATEEAIDYLGELFAAPRSRGTQMAIAAFSSALSAATITAVATTWTRMVLSNLSGTSDLKGVPTRRR